MINELIHLFLAVVVTFALYPIWIAFVYKYHMEDEISEDVPGTHKKKIGTPSMGGFVFILTVSLITFLFNRSRTQTLFPIFVTTVAGLLGVIEDLSKVYRRSGLKTFLSKVIDAEHHGVLVAKKQRGLISKVWFGFKEFTRIIGSKSTRGLQGYQKVSIQFAMAGFVAFWTYFKLGWSNLWLPLIGEVNIGFFYPIFIFFLFMSVLNFVAITDGLDGLAGGLALIAFGAYWIIASQLGYNSLAFLCATFIGALLPFLYFNVYPARIFMGDVGSHVLGSMLCLLAIVMHREIALVFILAVFLVDGLSSPLQQFSVKLTGKRLFRMAPIHHHFEMLGWPETKVTIRFWLAGIFFAFVGIFIALL